MPEYSTPPARGPSTSAGGTSAAGGAPAATSNPGKRTLTASLDGGESTSSLSSQPGPTAATQPSAAASRWDVAATPWSVEFPATEVGSVSRPCAIKLANRGDAPIEIGSLE